MLATMTDSERQFDELMARTGIEGLAAKSAFQLVGTLIDLSFDLKRSDGTNRAFQWCEDLSKRKISNSEAALLEYFRANAWSNRQREKGRTRSSVWTWEQPELQHQIFHLRRAIQLPGFAKFSALRRCQVYTNLANQLNAAGRFVDALEYWGRALAINPRFGMALGNRGLGLEAYAQALYDPGHQGVFLCAAHDALSAALSSHAIYESAGYEAAKSKFRNDRTQIESVIDVKRVAPTIDLESHKMGGSKPERHYRQWGLENRLFLNPLNDLGPYAIANRDVLMLPSFVAPIDAPPTLLGFYNQMKQEFVSARWFLYQATHVDTVHFSDRHVKLYNTLDYPSYSLAVEKAKAAFRISYSLFDKIAFFINDYMKLQIDPVRVNFRTIWYEEGGSQSRKRVLRPAFEQSENWPLRGLFWLGKDLFDETVRGVTEPDAQELHTIRNHLEHRYFKVHEMIIHRLPSSDLTDLFHDRLAYSVERKSFEDKTTRLLRLARAALIYLPLGMHREEKRRKKRHRSTKIAPMSLDLWKDVWKRR
jgi:hypothetical protein